VFDDIQDIAILNMKNHIFKANTSSLFQQFVLLVIPVEIAHNFYDLITCALCQHGEGSTP
jgi:hypothetical protein